MDAETRQKIQAAVNRMAAYDDMNEPVTDLLAGLFGTSGSPELMTAVVATEAMEIDIASPGDVLLAEDDHHGWIVYSTRLGTFRTVNYDDATEVGA